MKITICGSIAFHDEMLEAKEKLEALGHEVKLPPTEIPDDSGKMIPVKEYYKIRQTAADGDAWVWDRKKEAIKKHFDKVAWSEAILVLNHDKNSIEGYVGANTLMEMGLALHLGKKIYLLKNIPDISYKEEILGMKPEVIYEEFDKIKLT
ncbi:MAG: hypothetical protein HYT94_05300 [Parcubacteria group bacterium]|nr:hypothetical protein [Parcubacteria group bacterium]